MGSEIKRKSFHLVALVYVAAVLYLPRETFVLLLTGFLILEASLEFVRLSQPALNEWMFSLFGDFFREEEKSRVTGMFWMELGVLITALLLPPVRPALAALLYLIVGDAMASLVGKNFPGPHWPRSKKTVMGSLGCFIACMIIGLLVLRPEYGWLGVVAGAVVATAAEAGVLPFNDNFSMPVLSSVTLALCYGIRPLYF